jgi:hypothetical protein
MKTLIASLSLLSLLFLQNSAANFYPVRTSTRAGGQQNARTQEDARRKNFEKARNLLVAKGVPFDPEILLTPHWRRTLKPAFDQMPEFQDIRRGTRRLKGVEMAHTLYLPSSEPVGLGCVSCWRTVRLKGGISYTIRTSSEYLRIRGCLKSFLSKRRSYEKDHTGVNFPVGDEQCGGGAGFWE